MPTAADTTYRHNADRYVWYTACYNAFFWLPVFFLYFSANLDLEDVLRLEAIYYIAVVLLEVPSGYFSDVIGRRPTLLIASTGLVLAYGLFVIGGSFVVFAVAQVFLATGIAFNSGTDTAFHYDSLAMAGLEEEFADREAHVARVGFVASAVAALGGGAVALVTLRAAYGASLVAAIAQIGIVLTFVEPTVHAQVDTMGRGVIRRMRSCVGHLGDPRLRWLFAFAVLMTVINHIPYEFYQPYLDLLIDGRLTGAVDTPLVTGMVTAAMMLIAGRAAAMSIWLRDRLGTGRVLLLAGALQLGIILAMGLTLNPIIVALIILRSVPGGLMRAPMNAAIMPRLETSLRATYLSLQSLAGRLAFAGSLVTLSFVAGAGAEPTWESLSRMLLLSVTVGGGFWILLLVTVRGLRRPRSSTDAKREQKPG